MSIRPRLAPFACLFLASLVPAQLTPGAGTEKLVPFTGLSSGSGMVAAGTGMITSPGVINIDVPSGATVKQVLAIWAGQSNSNATGDDTIQLNGKSAKGELVGGPVLFFNGGGKPFYTMTYRADVTALGLISAGANSVTVTGLDFVALFAADKGASLVVVYDNGSKANLQLREGSDNAYAGFDGDRQKTVPQVFEFAASTKDRSANLALIVGAVLEDNENVISLQVDDGTPTLLENRLGSSDGPEWDTLALSVDIPAGATRLTVQVLSQDVAGSDDPQASVTWVGAGFSLDEPTTSRCFRNLDAKFWLAHQDLWRPTGLAPTDKVSEVFGLGSSHSARNCRRSWWRRIRQDRRTTLAEALARSGGSGLAGYSRNLVRAGVAALLNARHPGVSYRLDPGSILRIVRGGLYYHSFWSMRYYTRMLAYYNHYASICIEP